MALYDRQLSRCCSRGSLAPAARGESNGDGRVYLVRALPAPSLAARLASRILLSPGSLLTPHSIEDIGCSAGCRGKEPRKGAPVGFTPYLRDDYMEWKREGRLVNDDVHAKASKRRTRAWLPTGMMRGCSTPQRQLPSPGIPLQLLGNHGPVDAREPGQLFEGPARLWRVPVHA